jgi:hypothetical protein
MRGGGRLTNLALLSLLTQAFLSCRRGFAWVKWVVAVEMNAVPWWWQPPFPLQ